MHLRAVQFGGNKAFFEFMKEYKLMDELVSVEIDKRFKHNAVKYYARRLAAKVQDQPFSERQPAKDLKEKYVRVKNAMSQWVIKSEKKLDEIATKIDEKVMSAVEGSGLIDEEQKTSPIPVETSPANSANSQNETSTEQKTDWKKKFTGIFKIKKSGDADGSNLTQS